MVRKPTRKLATVAAGFLLVAAVATPRLGTAHPVRDPAAASPHLHASAIDPYGCPICGGGWDDFLGVLKIQIDLFASLLTGVRFG